LNRGRYLIDTLHDLLAQEYRPIEILVVDQSTEEAPALLDLVLRHADLISYHKVQFRGLPLARNYRRRLPLLAVSCAFTCQQDIAKVQVNGRNALTREEKFDLDVWCVDHAASG
jgi:hypothetical protein